MDIPQALSPRMSVVSSEGWYFPDRRMRELLHSGLLNALSYHHSHNLPLAIYFNVNFWPAITGAAAVPFDSDFPQIAQATT